MTGENLLQELELRLDNVVYRLGFADSRNQARQTVLHGHITLNGRRTNVPSARVRIGDVVAWTPGGAKTELFKAVAQAISGKSIPDWLDLGIAQMTGRVLAIPSRGQVDTKVNEQAIVEYYSR
jgi:small subunit ribosomal protein S4